MAEIVIYHNAKCSKSRETLALLRERGIAPHIVEYLRDPPSQAEILALVSKLGGNASALVRTKEKAYAQSGLTPDSDAQAIAAAIARDPILLERPVVVNGDRAAIGRPPEAVMEIL